MMGGSGTQTSGGGMLGNGAQDKAYKDYVLAQQEQGNKPLSYPDWLKQQQQPKGLLK